jgi:hypothetical protein
VNDASVFRPTDPALKGVLVKAAEKLAEFGSEIQAMKVVPGGWLEAEFRVFFAEIAVVRPNLYIFPMSMFAVIKQTLHDEMEVAP